MNSGQRYHLASAMILLAGGMGFDIRSKGDSKTDPTCKERPCLNCDKPKTHNNSYCSAKCCREHRAKKASGLDGHGSPSESAEEGDTSVEQSVKVGLDKP